MSAIARCLLPALACALTWSLALASPPPEVTGVVWCAGTKDCLSWTSVGPVTYQVFRGDPSTLPASLQASYHGDIATINAVLATLDSRLQTPLHLTDAQIADLVAFLKSLTDPAARDLSGLVPASVPSGLPVR